MQAGHADFRIHASNRFFKTDRNRTFDILPSLWMARPVPAANNVSEDLAEVGRARSRKIEPLELDSHTRDISRERAGSVVAQTQVGIAQRLVGARDLSEARFSGVVTRIDVGMIFAREAAIRPLDLHERRPARQP